MSGKPPLAIAALFAAALLATPALAGERKYSGDLDPVDSLTDTPRQRERGGREEDDFDPGPDDWRATRSSPYSGSWEDHADAYYGYGGCRFIERPIFDRNGAILDYRRFRICD